MDANRDREHLLALKVMRLTKPTFVSNPFILQCDSQRDLPLDTFDNINRTDSSIISGAQLFPLSEVLTLPQNFGNIFLGETFSSYISIHNDSKQICTEVSVKADLQTSTQRLTLAGASAPLAKELQPDCSIDEVIHHEVKELGTHILVCAVSYLNSLGDKQYFRKFFKFHVLKPLDVKTKFYHTESDDVYLEAQIQNITPGPIYLERVPLEPSPLYTVKEFQSDALPSNRHGVLAAGLGEPISGGARYLGPMDIHQYLYCLTPRPEAAADVRIMKGVTSIGKLDIVWKTNMGEKGRLQTSPLQRVAPGSGDVKVTMESIPQIIAVGQVFPVKLKVINCCEQRTMDLQLTATNTHSSGLLWTGVCGKALGKVESCAHIKLDLHLIAVRTGLLTVSGLRLTDTYLRRTYELDELAQVFVYDTMDASTTVEHQESLTDLTQQLSVLGV